MSDPVLHPGWPARLSWGSVELHPLRRRDAAEWSRLRLANEDWLAPWEPSASLPWRLRHTPSAYRAMRRAVARRGPPGTRGPLPGPGEGRLGGPGGIGNNGPRPAPPGAPRHRVDRPP